MIQQSHLHRTGGGDAHRRRRESVATALSHALGGVDEGVDRHDVQHSLHLHGLGAAVPLALDGVAAGGVGSALGEEDATVVSDAERGVVGALGLDALEGVLQNT